MSQWKRSFSLLLALLMIFTSVPLPAFAAQERVCKAHTQHDAACGYSDAVAGTPCGHVCGENCPTQEVTECGHDHTASGCIYTEPKEAAYCGHTCGDGTCAYQAAVAGVDCTCNPSITHAETCASVAEGECDCGATLTHEDTCAPVAAQAEVPCDFVHQNCGCAEAVTGGWNCAHECTVSSGCVKSVCIHACPGDSCGYTAPKEAVPCTHTCGVCQTQALIDALPGQITAENKESVGAQLTAIDNARLQLTDEQVALVDFTAYQSAIAAINTLNGQPGAEEPEAGATSGSCGTNASWSLSGGTLTISGSGAMSNFSSTGAPWYSNRSQITSIVVRNGITSIGNYAFYKCTNVTSVSLPSSIQKIGLSAFRECQMPSINLSNSITSINTSAFFGCDKLTSVTLPPNVSLNGYVFQDCTGLKKVTIPAGLTCPGVSSTDFAGCTGLTEVTIASGATTVYPWMFQDCTNLETVNLPDSLTTISEGAFAGCTAMTKITIPSGVTSIGWEAFGGNTKLSTITFTGNAPAIDSQAFTDVIANGYYPYGNQTWTASKLVGYGGNITWNADGAPSNPSGKVGTNLNWEFDPATGVLTITGSGAMAELGDEENFPWYSFRDDIKSVVIGENVTTIAARAFVADEDETQLESVQLPSTLVSIGDRAFYDCYYLDSVTLPDSVTTIGSYAFGYLNSISIGSGLKNVGEYALSAAIGLNSVTVSTANPYFTAQGNVLYSKDMTELVAYPKGKSDGTFTVPPSVTKIRSGAFARPSYLSKIVFSGAAPTLTNNSFQGVTAEVHYDATKSGWSSVVPNQYGGTITWVSNGMITGKSGDNITWTLNTATGAFTATGSGQMEYYNFSDSKYTPWHNYRSQIKSVTIGEGITSVGGYNFSGCSNLASVSLPSTLESIGNRAFSGCSALKSIALPKNLYSIGESAFNGAGLTSVTIPDSVGEIKHYAFQQCTSLTEVTFGKGLHTIGGNVFYYCTALRKATFTGGAPSAPDNDIFSLCTNVTATYPAGNTSWTEAKRRDVSTNATWKSDCDHSGGVTCVDKGDGKTHAKTCAGCGTVLAEQENHTFDANYLCACGAGKCGNNLTWSLSEAGVLTIFGTGEMWDYGSSEHGYYGPWKKPGTTLTSVVIQPGVTSIGEAAFYYCSDLVSATIPDTVTSIGKDAFRETKLSSITVPGSVKTIGDCAFQDCPLTGGVTLNSGLQVIGTSAFSETKVTSVTLPDTVTGLGEWVFSDCSALTSVKLSSGLSNIPANTFLNCTSLKTVTIPTGVTAIYHGAFSGSGITSITLPEGLKTVSAEAFKNTSGLKEIIIPAGVTELAAYAFQGSGLTKITFLGTPGTLGTSLFGSVTADVFYYENGKWNDSNKLQYGGTLKWNPLNPCADGHTYTYVADDASDTITVGCSECEFAGVFTLNAPASLIYTGSPVEATVTGEVEGVDTPAVTYISGTLTDGKPVNQGTYTAKMTLGGQSVTLTFTIAQYAASVLSPWNTTKEFTNLADAVAAANAEQGSTLTLLSNANETATVVITGQVKLDLNGYSLKNSNNTAIEIASGAKLTVSDSRTGGSIAGYVPVGKINGGAIVNNGTLILNGGTLSASGTNMRAAVTNSGTFTMNGGELKGTNSLVASSGTAIFGGGKVSAMMAVTGGTLRFHDGDFSDLDNINGYIRGADVTVYGGTFGGMSLGTPAATVNIYGGTFLSQFDKSSANVTLYGGTFNKGLKSSGENITKMLAEGHSFFNADGTVTSPNVYSTKDYLSVRPNDNQYVVSHYVDSVTTKYYSMDAGIAEASRLGGTLTLLKDITVTEPVKITSGQFKFFFGSYTISGNLPGGVMELKSCLVEFRSYTDGGVINTGTGSALALNNARFTLSSGTYQAVGNAITSYKSDLSVYKNATVISSGAAGVYVDNTDGSRIFLEGGKIQGVTAAVHAESSAVCFGDTGNVLAASAGPMILLSENAVLAVNLKLNADSAYTVKLNTATGTGQFGNATKYHYVEGSIIPYDPGLYVECADNHLYLRTMTAPEASIDFPGEQLTGLTPGAEYLIDGNSYTTDENGCIAILDDWMGKEITIVKVVPASSGNSPAQKLTIPSRPAAPTGFTVQDESENGLNDGSISDIPNGTQIRYPGQQAWNNVTGSALDNLTPGTYEFRQAATASSFASNVTEVTVASGKLHLTANDIQVSDLNAVYNGEPQAPTFTFPADLEEDAVTVRYLHDGKESTQKPTDAGDYYFFVDISGSSVYLDVEGLRLDSWIFTINKCEPLVSIAPIADQLYNGNPYAPELDVTFTYNGNTVTPEKGVDYAVTYENNVNVGTATATVKALDDSNYQFADVPVNFAIKPCAVTATIGDIPDQLYTGKALKPKAELTFTGVPAGMTLREGVDYTLSYTNNTAVGTATVTVKAIDGSNFTFTQTAKTFAIRYGVALPGVTGTVHVDGVPKKVVDGIVWLDNENAKLITTYSYANAGAKDPHQIYPTAMYVRELKFSRNGGYTQKRVTGLDNVLQYSGTSIRITGNQGIRFITSIPNSKKSALTGSGISGYKVVEYGTLMGWYEPGKELIYGVNAKSVAYNKANGTDQVFNRTGDLVQFTGMLTNLELKQSTRDLMTRPYMVLERPNGAGKTERVVLYGGSITRSIGYVAYQNKDVFKPGTSSYKFIWNILSYAYPELYKSQYKG